MTIDWMEAKACHDECGVGAAMPIDTTREWIEWLDNNPPPSSVNGVNGRKRTRKGEVRRQAKRLAQAKNSRAVGFGGWVLFLMTSRPMWLLILQIVQWWFARRNYEER